MLNDRTLFVVVEGHNRAGKTHLVEDVARELREQGVRVATYRDPGSTPIGEGIRSILKENKPLLNSLPNVEDEHYIRRHLHCAARRALSAELRDNLPDVDVVLCDRWYLSSFVYNTNGISIENPELMPDAVEEILGSVNKCPDLLHPDLILLLEEDSVEGRDEEKIVYRRFQNLGLAKLTGELSQGEHKNPKIIASMSANNHKVKTLHGSGPNWEKLFDETGVNKVMEHTADPAAVAVSLIMWLHKNKTAASV